jgi:hypothetical protein
MQAQSEMSQLRANMLVMQTYQDNLEKDKQNE